MFVIQIIALCIYTPTRCGTGLGNFSSTSAEDCNRAGRYTNTRNWAWSIIHTLVLLLLRGEFAVFLLFCRAREMFGYWHGYKGMLSTLGKIGFSRLYKYVQSILLILFQTITCILNCDHNHVCFLSQQLGSLPFLDQSGSVWMYSLDGPNHVPFYFLLKLVLYSIFGVRNQSVENWLCSDVYSSSYIVSTYKKLSKWWKK